MLSQGLSFTPATCPTQSRSLPFAAYVANSRATRPVDSGSVLARVRFWMMDPRLISDNKLGAFSFARDEAMVRATPADHCSLVVLLEGRCRFRVPAAA